jgi:hypothetical protein
MARAHGDSVHGQRSGLCHHPGRVVVAAGTRPGDHDDQVRGRRHGAYLTADQLHDVWLDRGRPRFTAHLARLRNEHQGVGVEDLALPRRRTHRNYLVPRGDHGYPRLTPYDELGGTRGCGRGDVDRAQAVPLGKQQLAGADVFSDRAHVLVGRHPRKDLGGPPGARLDVVHVLAHHDRVQAARHGVTGVDHDIGRRVELERGGLGGTAGVPGLHGDAVHRRYVSHRRGAGGPDRLCGHSPHRFLERDGHGVEPLRAAGAGAGIRPRLEGRLDWYVADEWTVVHRAYLYIVTLTVLPSPSPVAGSGMTT